jgi:hypothetical protein
MLMVLVTPDELLLGIVTGKPVAHSVIVIPKDSGANSVKNKLAARHNRFIRNITSYLMVIGIILISTCQNFGKLTGEIVNFSLVRPLFK